MCLIKDNTPFTADACNWPLRSVKTFGGDSHVIRGIELLLSHFYHGKTKKNLDFKRDIIFSFFLDIHVNVTIIK